MPTKEITESLILDYNNRQLVMRGSAIWLPELEFRLLAILAEQPGRPVGVQRILKFVWHASHPPQKWKKEQSPPFLKMLVCRLRERVGNRVQIQAVSRQGYRLGRP